MAYISWGEVGDREVVTKREAAELCGVTTQAIWFAVRQGVIKASQLEDKQRDWQINLASLKAWQEKRCQRIAGSLAFRLPS